MVQNLKSNNFKSLIARNFWLKVLALLLAVLIWGLVVFERTSEEVFEIPLEIANVPQEFVISDEAIHTVTIRVIGLKETIKLLTSRNLKAHIDLKNTKSKINTIEITSDNILVPHGVEITKISPKNITIILEKKKKQVENERGTKSEKIIRDRRHQGYSE